MSKARNETRQEKEKWLSVSVLPAAVVGELTRSADADRSRAQTQRFQHVRTAPDTTIDVDFAFCKHVRLVAPDFEQRFERRRRRLELPTAVIRPVFSPRHERARVNQHTRAIVE